MRACAVEGDRAYHVVCEQAAANGKASCCDGDRRGRRSEGGGEGERRGGKGSPSCVVCGGREERRKRTSLLASESSSGLSALRSKTQRMPCGRHGRQCSTLNRTTHWIVTKQDEVKRKDNGETRLANANDSQSQKWAEKPNDCVVTGASTFCRFRLVFSLFFCSRKVVFFILRIHQSLIRLTVKTRENVPGECLASAWARAG